MAQWERIEYRELCFRVAWEKGRLLVDGYDLDAERAAARLSGGRPPITVVLADILEFGVNALRWTMGGEEEALRWELDRLNEWSGETGVGTPRTAWALLAACGGLPAQIAARECRTSDEVLEWLARDPDPDIRMAVLQNSYLPQREFERLKRDPDPIVAAGAVKAQQTHRLVEQLRHLGREADAS